jgi:hypothetical protein
MQFGIGRREKLQNARCALRQQSRRKVGAKFVAHVQGKPR